MVIGTNSRIAVALELQPGHLNIDKWIAEPLRAIILPTEIFISNQKGFPVLPKSIQLFMFKAFKVKMASNF
jgi:protein arginine N-methyltransferase 5